MKHLYDFRLARMKALNELSSTGNEYIINRYKQFKMPNAKLIDNQFRHDYYAEDARQIPYPFGELLLVSPDAPTQIQNGVCLAYYNSQFWLVTKSTIEFIDD